MGGRRARALGRTGATPMASLPVGTQHALEARLAGEIDPFIGQGRHDTRRRLICEPRLVGNRDDARTLLFGQRMRRHRAFGMGPSVAHAQTLLSLPACAR